MYGALNKRVRKTSEKAGLQTKVMTTGDVGEVTVDGKIGEMVTSILFLGALVTRNGLCDNDIRRRIGMGIAAMGGLSIIWKYMQGNQACHKINVKLAKALVFPIVLYWRRQFMHLRCGVGGEGRECRGWREKLMYGCWKTSSRNGYWNRGYIGLLMTCGERGTRNGI